jgi:hypothetical protein
MRDTLDAFAATLPKWLWLQRYIAGQNWATKIRDVTHNAPLSPGSRRVSIFLTSPSAPASAPTGPRLCGNTTTSKISTRKAKGHRRPLRQRDAPRGCLGGLYSTGRRRQLFRIVGCYRRVVQVVAEAFVHERAAD